MGDSYRKPKYKKQEIKRINPYAKLEIALMRYDRRFCARWLMALSAIVIILFFVMVFFMLMVAMGYINILML